MITKITCSELTERLKANQLFKPNEEKLYVSFDDHEEWLEIRRPFIGGSDSACVLGLNQYKSAYSLWAEKTGKVEGFGGNLTTRIGTVLEDTVAHLFMEETGKKVQRCNFTIINKDYPFASANLDRVVVGENALLEIKTTNSIPNMKKLKKGEFPENYYCQVVHYMAVGNFDKAYLAVLINCREFKVFELERDEEEINALMEAEKNFYELIKNDTPPEVDGSESTSETLKEIYKGGDDNTVELFTIEEALKRRCEADEQLKYWDGVKAEAENQIKEVMGDIESATCNGFKISWKTSEGRKTFDKKALAKDYPDIDLAKYDKVGNPYRTFKVTAPKEDK